LGHNSATFDKADNEADDICTTDGLHRAVHILMRIKEGGLLWAAPVCRSWGFMNSCKCKRTQDDDFRGDLSYAPVREGNCMAKSWLTIGVCELHSRTLQAARSSSTSQWQSCVPLSACTPSPPTGVPLTRQPEASGC
jgi:hypothetical protein